MTDAYRDAALPALAKEPFPERELPPCFQLEAGRAEPWPLCAGVLFFCNENTRAECFRRQLFGDASRSIVDGLGDRGIMDWRKVKLFLLDVSQNTLVGVLRALGPAAKDIEPEAWHSRYPYQIRCEPLLLGEELPVLLRDAYRPLEQVHSSMRTNEEGLASYDLILTTVPSQTQRSHLERGNNYAQWLSLDQVNALVAMFGRRQVRVAAHRQLGTPNPDGECARQRLMTKARNL